MTTEDEVPERNIIRTHLPDTVVFRDHSKKMPSQRTIQCVCMFLDISGFTSLCEIYKSIEGGTDKLTNTLNQYMSALVEEILRYGGDIQKFAGDAILALWPCKVGVEHMRAAVIHVMKCALSMQEHYGVWVTSVNVKLRVKLAIAAGEIKVLFVGNDDFCHYVSTGCAVDAVNAAESYCQPGDVILSPWAWSFISKELRATITHKPIEKRHILVTGLEEDFDHDAVAIYTSDDVTLVVTKEEARKPSDNHTAKTKPSIPLNTGRRPSMAVPFGRGQSAAADPPNNSSSLAERFSVPGNSMDVTTKQKEGGNPLVAKTRPRRKAVFEQDRDEEKKRKLELYVSKPVLRTMGDQLSEMRQLTIVFMHLDIADSQIGLHMKPMLIQKAFNIVVASVKKMQGCLNKVFMFDKGCTLLILFGLPGLKHENDCRNALLSSQDMVYDLGNVEHIKTVSIGVTTGSTFCGVVGNPQRHEYTAIGPKVNMAARLMMNYQGKITCDQETYHYAKMPKEIFQLLEKKAMKGLGNVSNIREFLGCEGSKCVVQGRQGRCIHPILGRAEEEEVLREVIDAVADANSSEPSDENESLYHAIVFEGEPGIGKTRMLTGATVQAESRHLKVIKCTLTMHDAKMPYFVVRSLLVRWLTLDLDGPREKREKRLFKKLQDPDIHKNMFLLNDLLQLQLSENPSIDMQSKNHSANILTMTANMDTVRKKDLFYKLLLQIVHELSKQDGFLVFAVDDAQFMDQESWDFVGCLVKERHALVVMTVRTSATTCNQLGKSVQDFLELPIVKKIRLVGLQPEHMAPLACQLLDIGSIPSELETLLQQECFGLPAWCEQLLNDMMNDVNDVLSIDEQQNACIVNPGKSLDVDLPTSFKGMIQARIDRMRLEDQKVLKLAAILGPMFKRQTLEAIVTDKIPHAELTGVLERLIGQNILRCMYSPSEVFDSSTCRCPDVDVSPDTLPAIRTPSALSDRQYSACRALRFTAASFQEIAYAMIYEEVRNPLHEKAAQYIEQLSLKCRGCHGEGLLLKEPPSINVRRGSFRSFRSIRSPNQPSPAMGPSLSPQTVNMGPTGNVLKVIKRRNTIIHHFQPYALDVTPWMPLDSVSLLEEGPVAVACNCMEIRATVYGQLVRHWQAARNFEKTVHFMMEAGNAYIEICEFDKGLKYLQEIKAVREAAKMKRPNELEMARIERLRGKALYNLGKVDDSLPHFQNALRILGNPQPTTKFKIRERTHKERWRLWRRGSSHTTTSTDLDTTRMQNLMHQTRCLAHLFNAYNSYDDEKLSAMTVLQLVNRAEEVPEDIDQLIVAYTAMMEYCSMKNKAESRAKYEALVAERCAEA